MSPTDHGAPEVDSPFRRPAFMVSASFLLVVVLLAVLVILTTGDGDGADTGAAPAPSAPARSATPTADAGACPALKDTETALPDLAPKGVTWELFRTMALPSSKASGPAVTEGDVARCYARTPTGALLAAAQISTRSMLAEDWQSVMWRQTYGDAREELIKERSALEKKDPAPDPEPGELGQLAGFRFVTYSNSLAVIELVTRFNQPEILQASTVTLRWSPKADDWQYEISRAYAQPKSVDSLAGYVKWGGV
ncbi:hypothetical protein ABZ383_22660 [Streptomyces sp. NPDC005900]|uniref:hypothetical protein n=1 Tax=Streptomyces sp. NPDC005900 TaxID=3154569 RepID=UPI0033DEE94F